MRQRGWCVCRGSHVFIEALTALVERGAGLVERARSLPCVFLTMGMQTHRTLRAPPTRLETDATVEWTNMLCVMLADGHQTNAEMPKVGR